MNGGVIPQGVIDDILRRQDIVEVVGKYVPLAKQGKYYKGLCPFHSEKTPSFTVSPDKHIFHCFGCGKSGDVIKFVMEIESVSFPEAVKTLAEEAGIEVQWDEAQAEPSAEQKQRLAMIDAHEFAAKLYHYILLNTEQGRPGLDYLRNRGLSDRSMEEFQIGLSPERWDTLAQLLSQRGYPLDLVEQSGLIARRSEDGGYYDRFRHRVMFPIQDGRGRIVGFGGRIIGEGQPKYLNSPETRLFNKSSLLYNLHRAKAEIRKTGQAVLFEGYADVIQAWEAGVHNGVATMGTALTEAHARTLARYAKTVVVCYDGDDAGQSAARKSLDILEKAGLETRVACLPDKLDPDEYIRSRGARPFIDEILQDAAPATKFKLIYLQRSHILQEDEGKLAYVRAALGILAELDSPAEREHYLKKLSREYGYALNTLQHELHLQREERQKKQNLGDNNRIPWNNGRNDKSVSVRLPPLLPAYQQAEKRLLAAMLASREMTEYVRERLGASFNVEDHAALAAYLYAYYAEGHSPNIRAFMAVLQDARLEAVAASVAMLDPVGTDSLAVIDDYIREVKKVPQLRAIELKRQEIQKAERLKDYAQAARIASEVLEMERQLKQLQP